MEGKSRVDAFERFKKESLFLNGRPVIKAFHREEYGVNEWFCIGNNVCGPGASPEMAYDAWRWLGGIRGE